MRKINSDESGEESRNTPSPVFKGGRGTEKKGEITKPTSGEEEAERDSTAIARENYDGTLILISPMKTIIHREKRGRRKCRPSLAFASDKTGKTKQ